MEATISIRNLVEFILRSGDIDNSHAHTDADAMQEGTRLHKKIQKSQKAGYRAEVPLKVVVELKKADRENIFLTVEGRADGIFEDSLLGLGVESTHFVGTQVDSKDEPPKYWIDEIKCSYLSLEKIDEPIMVHLAQAKCYAYIYALQNELSNIGVQMTYCHIETEEIKRFQQIFAFSELSAWFDGVVGEYSKWLFREQEWLEKRNESIHNMAFPFAYRDGQRDLVGSVYRSIKAGKKLFIEAPTGVGKTISTVFPAIFQMGEGRAEKIFYLTAKTIARTVAEDTFSLLVGKGLFFRFVTITSKEKSCVLEKPDCNPAKCPRAKGHFDRINDCVFELLENETSITRELIFEYAEKHNVCPFEMCLDATLWADAVVCDYNYVFDPRASLKRYFENEKKNDFILLIDEAHNLLERAREMYSAELVKEDVLTVRRIVEHKSKRTFKALDAVNKNLLAYKHECDDFQVWDNATDLYMKVNACVSVMSDYLEENVLAPEEKEPFLNLYFAFQQFVTVYETMGDNYRIYTDYTASGDFRMKLLCMEPAALLKERMDRVTSAILFSATLLPMPYYKEQLGGQETDFAVYAPSPFKPERRQVLIGTDVSTRYTNRNTDEYVKIADYIEKLATTKKGNYMVFFSSYKMLEDVLEVFGERDCCRLIVQKRDMTESEKDEFLNEFESRVVSLKNDGSKDAGLQVDSGPSLVAFCVMGGIFSEGIDLTGDRLSGAIIVGCGLPQVGYERELFKNYFDEKNGKGFEYAYLYPGMNKVLQSGGRVIRTVEDIGTIILLDDRFLKRQYTELFPREWFPFETVNRNNVSNKIKEFYDGKNN